MLRKQKAEAKTTKEEKDRRKRDQKKWFDIKMKERH